MSINNNITDQNALFYSRYAKERALAPERIACLLEVENKIKMSFTSFIEELEKEIFPFYERHEKTFDELRFHGRMHAGRAVIFSEVMARYFKKKDFPVDIDLVRRATGLHDAGRECNGTDYWEKQSAELLSRHLTEKGVSEKEAFEQSRIIIKDAANVNPIECIIFQSADCLDIMRLLGRRDFRSDDLHFLFGSDGEDLSFRNDLIEEAWLFIEITEKMNQDTVANNGFMNQLFNIIRENKSHLPILSSIL